MEPKAQVNPPETPGHLWETTIKRRGLFAAVAALVAAIIAKPKEVAATAGGGPDGNLVLGSNFITSPNTTSTLTIVAPSSTLNYPAMIDVDASYFTPVVTNINALYGHARGAGSGVIGVTGAPTAAHLTEAANCGVIGYGIGGAVGVSGNSDTNFGVLGNAGTGGVGVYGVSPYVATVGHSGHIGVWGQTSSAGGYGVYGNATTNGGFGVFGQGTPWAGAFAGGVFVNGQLTVTGAKAAAVPHPDGSLRRLYCVESPESWFEDFGNGQLVEGQANVTLDPDFAALVHCGDYHVFLTAKGDSNGLYVCDQTPDGFEVREQRGGASSLAFSYRVVAKRKDIAGLRLEKVEKPDFSAVDGLKPLEVPPPPGSAHVSNAVALP